MRSISARARKPGFSLLEVLVALFIISVITAVSFGRFHRIIVRQRVARAATSLQSDLQGAFAIASRNRQPVRIIWNAGKLQMGVTDRSGSVYYRRTPLGQVYGLASSGVSFSRSPVSVYPNGLAEDALTIVLTVEDASRTIRMSRAGMVSVQ